MSLDNLFPSLRPRNHHVLDIHEALKWSRRLQTTPPDDRPSNSADPSVLPSARSRLVNPLIGRALNGIWSQAIISTEFLHAADTVLRAANGWQLPAESVQLSHAINALSRWPESTLHMGGRSAVSSRHLAQAIRHCLLGSVHNLTET